MDLALDLVVLVTNRRFSFSSRTYYLLYLQAVSQMFCIHRTNQRRRGKRSTRNTGEERKRRQRHIQTLISTDNRIFTVLSLSWQFTSSVISALKNLSIQPNVDTDTLAMLELSELSEESLRGGLRVAAAGSYLLFVFTTMLLENNGLHSTSGQVTFTLTPSPFSPAHVGDSYVTGTFFHLQFVGPLRVTLSASYPTYCISSC